MSIEAIAGAGARLNATSGEVVRAVSAVDSPANFAGTSDAAVSNAPYRGDFNDAVQAQVNDMIRAEQRQQALSGIDPQTSGVASAPLPPVANLNEALAQVRSMFQFSVKATLLGSVANQSVAAVTTLAKSQ